MASVPARAPGPKTATNSKAQIKEFTEREVTKTKRASPLRNGLRVTFRAPSTATGTAKASDSSVPSVAMWKLSLIHI